MEVKIIPPVTKAVEVAPERVVLDLSRDEAEAILFTLGRIVSGPTDSLSGLNLYSPMYDALFGTVWARDRAAVRRYKSKADGWLKTFRF